MAVGILGLDAVVLHLDGAILEFEYPIQGFEYHILKFMIFKQFDGLAMVAVVLISTNFYSLISNFLILGGKQKRSPPNEATSTSIYFIQCIL